MRILLDEMTINFNMFIFNFQVFEYISDPQQLAYIMSHITEFNIYA